jgi:hypothetical protein
MTLIVRIANGFIHRSDYDWCSFAPVKHVSANTVSLQFYGRGLKVLGVYVFGLWLAIQLHTAIGPQAANENQVRSREFPNQFANPLIYLKSQLRNNVVIRRLAIPVLSEGEHDISISCKRYLDRGAFLGKFPETLVGQPKHRRRSNTVDRIAEFGVDYHKALPNRRVSSGTNALTLVGGTMANLALG